MSAPLPQPRANADDGPYWEAARRGELLLRRCVSCGQVHFPPRAQCPGCWSNRLEWTPASGRATVYTYTIMQRAPLPEFVSRLPYVVALVDLAEGVRMMANIVGEDALGVGLNEPVELCFEERGAERLPQFRRLPGSS